MTDVSREGRISPGCTGMYKPEHVTAWERVVEFVHAHSPARIALQLAHAGRKGSTRRLWEGIDEPLAEGNWPLISASAIPYFPHSQIPKAMDRADMERVQDDFVKAASMAEAAGFDMLELHMAHGYLLASFVSPLTNTRTDAYGGTLDNRLRYPLAVFDAVRAVWPAARPISVKISATDWADGGVTPEESVEFARRLKAHGCDLVTVSTGQTVAHQHPAYGRLYQTPFSDRIRHEAGIATMTVGAVASYADVNSILAAGRADLCALARGHLDAGWPLADQHAPPAVDPGRQASLLPRVRRDGASGHRRLEARLRRADDPAAAPARVRAVVAGGHRVSWLGPGGPRVLRAARRLGPPTPARVRRRRELRLSRDPLPGARRPRRRLRAEPGLPRVLRGVVRGEQCDSGDRHCGRRRSSGHRRARRARRGHVHGDHR